MKKAGEPEEIMKKAKKQVAKKEKAKEKAKENDEGE
jgi:hypothetical protein